MIIVIRNLITILFDSIPLSLFFCLKKGLSIGSTLTVGNSMKTFSNEMRDYSLSRTSENTTCVLERLSAPSYNCQDNYKIFQTIEYIL